MAEIHENERQKDRSKPSLSDMPIEIIEDIISDLAAIDRIAVQKVSRGFRDVINREDFGVKRLSLEVSTKSSILSFDDTEVEYKNVHGDCLVKSGNREKIVNGSDHSTLSMNDIHNLLKNPKVQLDYFGLVIAGDQTCRYENVLEMLQSLNFKLCVKNFSVARFPLKYVISFFKCLAAEQIENITFYSDEYDEENPKELVKLEQWKKAKFIEIYGGYTFPFKVEDFLHFTTFWVRLGHFTTEDAAKVRDVLMKPNNINYGYFDFSIYDPIAIARIFEPNYNGPSYGALRVHSTGGIFSAVFSKNQLKIKRKSNVN